MPRRDGSGPMGLGPRTGRKLEAVLDLEHLDVLLVWE